MGFRIIGSRQSLDHPKRELLLRQEAKRWRTAMGEETTEQEFLAKIDSVKAKLQNETAACDLLAHVAKLLKLDAGLDVQGKITTRTI